MRFKNSLQKKMLVLSMLLIVVSSFGFSQEKPMVVFPYIVDVSQSPPVVTNLPNQVDGGGYSDGIFDGNCNLVFYVTGNQIFDKNGVSKGNTEEHFSVEGAIVKKPGSNNRYYIIYSETLSFIGINYYYQEVEVIGETINVDNEILLNAVPYYENIAGIAVSPAYLYNNNQYLFVTSGNIIYKYNIVNTGITLSQTYNFSGSASMSNTSELELSPDGSKLIWVENTYNKIGIFNINEAGTITDHVIRNPYLQDKPIGCEFSKQENIVYLTTESSLYEYNISTNQKTLINNQIGGSQLEYSNGYIWGQDGDNFYKIDPNTGALITDVITGYIFLNNTYWGFNVLPDYIEYFTASVTSVTDGDCNSLGSVTIEAYLSTPPYHFNFNNGEYYFSGTYGDNTFQVVPGTYDIVVTDNTNNSLLIEDIEVDGIYTFPTTTAITTNTTWTEDYKIMDEVRIDGNVTLTIENRVIEFGENGSITIDQGGTLIINNSTLTNLPECTEMWEGIHSYNGELIINNNSIIENTSIEISDGSLEIDYFNTFIIPNNTLLYTHNSGKIILKNGSAINNQNGGTLSFNQSSEIIFEGNSEISINSGSYICLSNPTLTFETANSKISFEEGSHTGTNPIWDDIPLPNNCNELICGITEINQSNLF